MTTIAFDGKTIAVDKASWRGNVCNQVTKLFHVNLGTQAKKRFIFNDDQAEIIYCAAGNAAEVPLIVDWMSSSGELPVFEDKSFGRGLVLCKATGQCYSVTGLLTLEPYDSYPIADGIGHEMALGAMLAGADAALAVTLTASRSQNAHLGVDSFTLPELC